MTEKSSPTSANTSVLKSKNTWLSMVLTMTKDSPDYTKLQALTLSLTENLTEVLPSESQSKLSTMATKEDSKIEDLLQTLILMLLVILFVLQLTKPA